MADQSKNPSSQKVPQLTDMLEDVLTTLKQSHTPSTKAVKAANIDTDEFLEQMEESLEELSQTAEALRQQTGMTKEQLQAFAEDEKNFSKSEWELLSQIKSELARYEEEARAVMEQPGMAGEGGKKEAGAKPKGKKGKKGWVRT